MKPKVLVLGTHHMEFQQDMSQETDARITLLPEREKEIMMLLEKIKVFQPTKVAVETEVKLQEHINQQYEEYLNSGWTLPINEIYQIGFQLAHAMNHKQVHAIDWMDTLPEQKEIGDVLEWAEKNQTELHRVITEK